MYLFFQCVAEAVAEHGLRGFTDLVPGGGAMFDIAEAAWRKYRERRQVAEMRDDVQRLAQAGIKEVEQAANAAAKQAAAAQPELLPTLELYLTQIPAAVRKTLKRADDPTGTTAPAAFSLRSADDVAKLLPPSLPRFRAGDALPGKAGWVLERQLGVGGFGEVWLARHPKFQSLFGAVKFCRHLQTRDRDMLHEGKLIDRLLAEGPHPNIVKLQDVHLEGDAPWLMFEYVDGGDLADLIHEWAGLPASERQQKAIAALRELAQAIGHFHRLDPAIVHRDLKPANILRDKQGRLRITDFGIGGVAARQAIENDSRGTTSRAGRLQSYLYGSYTPLYASPQQRDGADPDPRDDVHALGVIGYQMLTGQLSQGVGPDFAEDLKEAGIGDGLIGLLRRCTAQKVERRPNDAGQVADALTQLPTQRKGPPPLPEVIPVLEPAPMRPIDPDEDDDSVWHGALKNILSDPIRKVAFINQTRALLEMIETTETNMDKTRVLSIIAPAVFGGGSTVMIVLSSLVFARGLSAWTILFALVVGVSFSGLLLLGLTVIRRAQLAKQTAAVATYAAAYPTFAERCGGVDGFRNKELLRSVLLAVDDLSKRRFMERMYD